MYVLPLTILCYNITITIAKEIGMLDWFIRLYGNYADRRAVEMTTRVLRGMSDAELQDIGITRGDIWAVARGKCGRTIK